MASACGAAIHLPYVGGTSSGGADGVLSRTLINFDRNAVSVHDGTRHASDLKTPGISDAAVVGSPNPALLASNDRKPILAGNTWGCRSLASVRKSPAAAVLNSQ